MGKKFKLSFCAIVKDNLKNVSNLLKSIEQIVDEKVIVDTGSSPEVLAYEKEHADKVISIKWDDDFASARNLAIENTSGDWILMPDSDETLSPKLAKEILVQLSDVPDDIEGFYFKEVHYFDEPNPFPDYWKHLKLFRRKAHYVGAVHESIKNLKGLKVINKEGCFLEHHNTREYQKIKCQRYVRYLKEKLASVREAYNKQMVEYYEYKLWVQKKIYNLETDPHVDRKLLEKRYAEYEVRKQRVDEKIEREGWVII